MFHHNFFGSLASWFVLLASILFFSNNSFADDDNLLDRNRHAGRRNSRFYFNDNQVRHLLALSGEYDSDEDSKQSVIKLDHYYKSGKFISDTEISYDTIYEIQRGNNSKDKNKYLIKERDLFRLVTSQKMLLFATKNYFIFFNESRHDNESDYSYRDVVSSAGFGRSFLNQMLEFDISFGQASGKNITDTTFKSSRKNYKRKVMIPSYRFEKRLGKNIRFISRGYFYDSGDIKSFYNSAKIQYRINKSIFLQLNHLFDQRKYQLFDKRSLTYEKKVNEARRQVVFGLRFEL